MEITNDFLNELDDIFEVELGTIKPNTNFKDLDEWDSVTLLSLVAVFEEEYAVACAVQNILLGINSLNIIGYWSTPKMCFTSEFKSYLKLNTEDKCMGILQLGVKKPNLPAIPKQLNGAIKDKVEWFS